MKQKLLIERKIVLMDDREDKLIEKILKERGIHVIRRRLEVADYVIGDIGIERKSFSDFVNSIIDKRLFEQARNLRENFQKPLFIVEKGYTPVNISDNAIRGAILSLYTDFGIPVIFSRGLEDTAEYIYLLAKEKRKYIQIGRRKKGDVRINILCAFPGIGTKKAEALLQEFGNLISIFESDYLKLKKILGEKIALKFIETLRR